jgi:hypothetical protein
MLINEGIIETPLAHRGMLTGQALQICVNYGVPGIPYVNDDSKVTGRFSVRHTFLFAGIPSDMVKGAHLIGEGALQSHFPQGDIAELFAHPVEEHLLNDVACLPSNSQIIKAMALMERFNSSYLFVIDHGIYRGTVTRLSLTRALLAEFA